MHNNQDNQARSAEILAEAIHRKQIVEATYNAASLKLAPHQLFLRNDALYVAALNPQKSRRVDEEPALGVFKLAGLSGVALTDQPFSPVSSFGEKASRPEDLLLASIDLAGVDEG